MRIVVLTGGHFGAIGHIAKVATLQDQRTPAVAVVQRVVAFSLSQQSTACFALLGTPS